MLVDWLGSAIEGAVMGERRLCAFIKPDGSQCRAWPPRGEDLCMAHGQPERLAKSREEARLRKLADHEMRKPPAWFLEEGWDARPFRPVKETAERGNVDKSTVIRWQAWVRNRDAQAARREEWKPEGNYPAHWSDLTEDDLPRLVEDVAEFRAKYFKDRRGRPYLTPAFQRVWLAAMLKAIITGGRLIIQSPPRHGKTELLIHTSIWLLVHWPQILILWVGGNERVAQRSVGMVMRHLMTNKALIDDFAGPGRSFKPGSKDSLPWSKSEFTVATTPEPEKGRTMTALGRGGTLLSLDADVIVEDDIEDHQSTVQPAARQSTREWQTSQLESRKEEHTALIDIGSRQHPDDLAGHLLDSEEWESIVETAHDRACRIPTDDPDRYDEHVSCMLFPEIRTYKWLMAQKRAAESAGGEGIFNMVYLNESSDAALQVFSPAVVDPCLAPTRVLGKIPNEPGQLVAGLDPSGTAYQAAVLVWFAVRPKLKIVVVDIDNTRGGGIPQFGRIMREWWDKYKVPHWVVEENLHLGAMTQDRDIRDYAASHNIRLEDWRTFGHKGYSNKLDPRIGVTSMQPWFANKQILLPYGDSPSRLKMDVFRDQLIYWDGNAPRNRNKSGLQTDLVMALWFCKTVIYRAQLEFEAEMGVEIEGYEGYEFDDIPWELAGV